MGHEAAAVQGLQVAGGYSSDIRHSGTELAHNHCRGLACGVWGGQDHDGVQDSNWDLGGMGPP